MCLARQWSWKLECVTTHLPHGLAPKIDVTDTQSLLLSDAAMGRGGTGMCYEALGVSLNETVLVQTMVVVAKVQMRALKTEAENGNM